MKEYVLRLTEAEYEALKLKIGNGKMDATDKLSFHSVEMKINKLTPTINKPIGILKPSRELSKHEVEEFQKLWDKHMSGPLTFVHTKPEFEPEPAAEEPPDWIGFDLKDQLAKRNPILR